MNHHPPGKTIEILLVEDNWGDAFLMSEAFRESPYPVNLNIVTDGEEALAYINRDPKYSEKAKPDLVLLDLNLPRMDGRAVLRRIKSDPKFQDLRIVILTSSNLDTDIREAFDMQAVGFVVKPTDLAGFQHIIESIRSFWMR